MRGFIKFILISAVFFVFSSFCSAKESRIIVASVSIPTPNSTVGIYSNISDYIATDIINNLNKNLLFDAPDFNTTEYLLMSHGLWEKYRDFLSNYKDRGIIDYRMCALLREKLGVHKILLVSSGFSMQSMLLERSFWYKIGLTEFGALNSKYRMDVNLVLVDTQSGLVVFEDKYKETFKTKDFEVPSNSLSDNVVSIDKIKDFSEKIAEEITVDVVINTDHSAYTDVKSSIISDSSREIGSREGAKTRDGHSFSVSNADYLKKKRKESFKNWVKDRIDY